MSHKNFTLELVDTLLLEANYHHDNPGVPEAVLTRGSPRSLLSATQHNYVSPLGNTNSTSPPSRRSLSMTTSDSQSQYSWVSSKPRYSTNLTLDDYNERLEGEFHEHCRVNSNNFATTPSTISKKRQAKACVYCTLLFAEKKKKGGNGVWNKEISRTEFRCSKCKYFLCEKHFEVFHSKK